MILGMILGKIFATLMLFGTGFLLWDVFTLAEYELIQVLWRVCYGLGLAIIFVGVLIFVWME